MLRLKYKNSLYDGVPYLNADEINTLPHVLV